MEGLLDIDSILASRPGPRDAGTVLGTSRQGRPIHGTRFGAGPQSVTLIAGCHADEPVGPAMLLRLMAWLDDLDPGHPANRRFTWHLVPDANPDGAEVNARWARSTAHDPGPDEGYDLADYLRHAVREPPGDDVEFGFPRHAADDAVRPENAAVAAILRDAAPIALHASFHGMAFAAGPWFLLEPAWIDRTRGLRDRVRSDVHDLGYRLHDIDRGGDKGFVRIDEGFTTRPNAAAMAAHFEALGDDAMAAAFRPSSMDYARSLGDDPLTMVSEMPLFLTPPDLYDQQPVRPPALAALAVAATQDRRTVEAQAAAIGVRPMPILDQMRLQLAYLAAALDAVTADLGAR